MSKRLTSMRLSRAKRLALVVVLLGSGAAGGSLALARGNGVTLRELTLRELGVTNPVPAEKLAAVQRFLATKTTDANAQPAPVPAFTPDRIPPHILGPNVPVPISPSIVQTTNGWLVSDGVNLVAVYAGAVGADPSQGRVVIVRQNLVAGTQTVHFVEAGRTGPLAIASGPTGTSQSAETAALTGHLVLEAHSAATFRLQLGPDTISG
jgi:hypothetical protein